MDESFISGVSSSRCSCLVSVVWRPFSRAPTKSSTRNQSNVPASFTPSWLCLCSAKAGPWLVALRGFQPSVSDGGYLAAIATSKDPPQFVVLVEDTAALIGIAIVLVGTWASIWKEPRLDGIASVAIGLVLAQSRYFWHARASPAHW
jgi:hypothetical protein